MIRKINGKVVSVCVAGFGLVAQARAAVPAEITAITTDVESVWDAAKAIAVGVVAFSLLIWAVKKVRAR